MTFTGGPSSADGADGAAVLNPSRMLVINDFSAGSGAEGVYRTTVDVLAAIPDVSVETFDETNLAVAHSLGGRIWNFAAARALQSLIDRFRPTHVWVHNYHNNLSASVLPVIRRARRRLGCSTYMTCHDYFTVFYDPAMIFREGETIVPVPLSDLGSLRAVWKRSSAKGLLHDVFKKAHWHLIDWWIDPLSTFDVIFCPSKFLEFVLENSGVQNRTYLANPLGADLSPATPRILQRDAVRLAFAGRISAEKGLDQFIALAGVCEFQNIECITIFGEGDERPRLQQKYNHLVLDEKLHFVGKLPHDRLLLALREHDALVLPSIWYENAPLVVVEAAALGLPVLVHRIGSLITFGNDLGNKILYHSDPESFTAAMKRLLAHLREQRQPYDLAAFSLERYTENLRAIFQV